MTANYRKFWLVITKESVVYRSFAFKVLKTKPKTLTLNQVAMEVNIAIQDEWFQRPVLKLNLNVKAPMPLKPETLKPLEIESVLREAGFAVRIIEEGDDENENKISM